MNNEIRKPHPITVEVIEPPPSEVAVGDAVVLRVQVSCADGCDLRGMPIQVTATDGAVATDALATFDNGVNERGTITLKAPLHVGEHGWTITCLAHETAGALHEEKSLMIPIRVIAHRTSLAVWDVPSPVVAGERFAIKVGAKSVTGCDLNGQTIAVRDDTGSVVASGRLGDAPWPDTTALFWTSIELVAPIETGIVSRTVSFDAPELELAHSGTSSRFSTAVVQPPEYRLTVKVIEKQSQAPIGNAQIRLGVYRAATDETGLAEVQLPKGDYELFVWKADHDAPTIPVRIEADVSVEVEATKQDEDPYAPWRM